MANNIQGHHTIFEITEQYPQSVAILCNHGLEQLTQEPMRATMGKRMQLQTVCQMRHLDLAVVLSDLHQAIAGAQSQPITVRGVLPCPIRLPLLEKIQGFLSATDMELDYTLPAASTGLDWLMAEIQDEETLADVYVSAGFSLFFDQDKIGKFKDQQVFKTQSFTYHPQFDNPQLSLKDPQGIYTILGIVPAVFIVNTQLLNGRPIPKTWEDLFQEAFADSIAVPMQDLDLFNAVLLNVYKQYGTFGVAQLGKNCVKNMHPAQMVKNAQQNQTPCVSISPYFFTSMLPSDGSLVAVWPEDGAVVSPIFLLCKEKTYGQSQPFVDFLQSKEIATVLSANGKFPATCPEVDNGLSPDLPFLFCGWDFLHSQDVKGLLERLERVFLEGEG